MPASGDLLSDAAAWAVRLSGEAAGEADWLAFVAWLDGAPASDPEQRRRAFDEAQRVWLESSLLRSVEPSARRRPRHSVLRSRSLLRRAAPGLAAVAAAALLLFAGGWLMSSHIPVARTLPAIAYATTAGQHQVVRLPDGSRIDMDGDTRLEIGPMATGPRTVTLVAGEARFDVIHDPSRPFTVDLGASRVRVLGTVFDVVRDRTRTQVSVSRGAVSLQTSTEQVRVPAGRMATLADGRVRLAPVEPSDVGAWRQGRRLYWDQPLGAVVADLNRTYAEPVRLGDAASQRLRFTGVLVVGDQAQTLHRLTLLLPLQVSRASDGALVLGTRGRTN